MPPPDIEVPAVAAARLFIESRFDLLPLLFRTPSIVTLQESLPASHKALTSPAVQSEGSGFEMRGATAASFEPSPEILPLANVLPPPAAMAESVEKHAFAASTEISSSDSILDSGFQERNLVDEEEPIEEFGAHKELEQESELHLRGLGGGAVVVGCSADADTVDMLYAMSQSLKTSNLKASVQTVSPP
jgi:hypothetical protein